MVINPINSDSNIAQLEMQKSTGDFQNAMQNAINSKDDNQLKQECVNLQTEFVKLMLNEMRKTIPKDPITGNDFGTDVFTSMMYDKYAESLSENTNIGLADEMYKQLSKQA